MTQVITAVEADVREIDEPLTKRFIQRVILTTTGANTDTAWDFGSYVTGSLGTFWTATSGSTAGAIALGIFQQIAVYYKTYQGVKSPDLNSRTKVGAGGIVYFTSAAISTGTSVSATVTGLLSTDVIMSVTQATANANSLVPVAFGAVGTGTLALTYASTSGANGTVSVVAYRKTGTQVIGIGQYGEVNSNGASNITFATTDGPTAAIWYFEWDLLNNTHGVKYSA